MSYAILVREGQRVGLAFRVEFREDRDLDAEGNVVASRVSGHAMTLRTLKTREMDGYDFWMPEHDAILRGVRIVGPVMDTAKGLVGEQVDFQALEVGSGVSFQEREDHRTSE